jgi:hypothetical protein
MVVKSWLHQIFQGLNHGLINEPVEEGHILGTVGQDMGKNVFQKFHGQATFPSRSQKAISGSTIQNSARWRACIGVLSPERGTEGVNIPHGEGVNLRLQLTADR